MICFEVSVNGRSVCTAGIGHQEAEMAALLCAISVSATEAVESPPVLRLDVRGAADDTEMTWLEEFDQIALGDTIAVRIVECAEPEAPRRRKDNRTLHRKREDARSGEGSRCCFCHQPQSDHRKLVAGPPVFICHECVRACTEILETSGVPPGGTTV